jgi:low affinity Fe/Cu permease
MKAIPCAVVARRLRARGFRDITADEACRIAPWLCFTPTLQAILFGMSTITGSAPALRVMAAALFVGAIMGRHPFDWIYDGVIRYLEESPKLPDSPPRRRAVFVVGGVWCLVTAAMFTGGSPVVGYALGAAMTLSTALLALTHICSPSRVVAWITGRAGLDEQGVRGG